MTRPPGMITVPNHGPPSAWPGTRSRGLDRSSVAPGRNIAHALYRLANVKGPVMRKLDRVYAYSNPSLSKPDLRITVSLLPRSRVAIHVSRTRGTGDPPHVCWLSEVEFMILCSVVTRVVAEMTRTKKRSVDLPVKLILVPGGFDFVVAPGSTARPSLRLAGNPGSSKRRKPTPK
jgi:hypothetical protein